MQARCQVRLSSCERTGKRTQLHYAHQDAGSRDIPVAGGLEEQQALGLRGLPWKGLVHPKIHPLLLSETRTGRPA